MLRLESLIFLASCITFLLSQICPPDGSWIPVNQPYCNDTCGNCGTWVQDQVCSVSLKTVSTFAVGGPCAPQVCKFPRKVCCQGVRTAVNDVHDGYFQTTNGSWLCLIDGQIPPTPSQPLTTTTATTTTTTPTVPCRSCVIQQLTLTQGPEPWMLPYSPKGVVTYETGGCSFVTIYCNNTVKENIYHSFNYGQYSGFQFQGYMGYQLFCNNDSMWTWDGKNVYEVSCQRAPTTTTSTSTTTTTTTTTALPCGSCTMDQVKITQGKEPWMLPYSRSGIVTYSDGCKYVSIYCTNAENPNEDIYHSFNNGLYAGITFQNSMAYSLRCKDNAWTWDGKPVYEISCQRAPAIVTPTVT